MVQKPWELDISIYDSEAELLNGLRRQEPIACTCFLKEYAPAMLRLALRITGDPDEAENVLQESFITACNRIDDFQGLSSLGTWMYRIVMNNALMSLRRKRPDLVPFDENGDTPGLAAGTPEPIHEIMAAELQESLNQAVMHLPEKLRTAFVLRGIEGLRFLMLEFPFCFCRRIDPLSRRTRSFLQMCGRKSTNVLHPAKAFEKSLAATACPTKQSGGSCNVRYRGWRSRCAPPHLLVPT